MAATFTHQVGGHASTILSSPLSSSTLIKPASRTELDFYRSLGPALGDGEFSQEWCPAFYGTLTLQGKPADARNDELSDDTPTRHAPPEMLVLENLTHKFRRPNVLDIKLGQVLYDESSASAEKVERMKRAAENTTSGELGLRLTGFQVWDYEKQEYVQTPKPFGRTLRPSELDLGLSRFFYPHYTFLSASEGLASTSTSSPLSPDLPVPPTSFPPSLPPDLVLPILRTLVRRLERLSTLLKTLKGLKMRGASLLIVVEGDPAVLEKSLLRAVSASSANEARDDDEEEEEEEDDLDDEGNAVEESLIPFEIKVIDFAHTTLTPDSESIEEGVVVGVDNVRKGLERLVGRIDADEKQLRN